MPDRLKLDDDLFPVQTFFNALGDDSFAPAVNALLDGVGYSINDCDCSFPGDLDPGEETFEGVRFSIFEDKVVISVATLHEHVKAACSEQLRLVGDDKKLEVECILEKLN